MIESLWCSVRAVRNRQAVVQQNSIETLHQHRISLIQMTSLSQGFNGYWFKHVTSNKASVLYLLASGRQFCPCLKGGFSDIWLSQMAEYCDVPAQRLAALSRNECETIWSLPVRLEQPDGLFGDGNHGTGKATSNQVVESMMSSLLLLLLFS